METKRQQESFWYKSNFLLTNPDKFQSLTINPRNLPSERTDAFIRIMVKETGTVRLLGVNIDNRLNFPDTLVKYVKRFLRKIGVVMRLRNLIPCNAKLLLYKSFILPHLAYPTENLFGSWS